jgi:hypothetical protein
MVEEEQRDQYFEFVVPLVEEEHSMEALVYFPVEEEAVVWN